MGKLTSLIEQAERCLPRFVHDAHALGASPDDAQLRFDPESSIADNRWPHEP